MLIVGFITYTGTVTAASNWDGPAERRHVRRALPGSWEELFHEWLVPAFVVDARTVPGRRLERASASSTVPRPSASRTTSTPASPTSSTPSCTSTTHALEPLERTSRWEAGELPETYQWGV